VTSWCFSRRRHICPPPATTYQISWTVACDTAFDTCPGASSNCAKLAAPGRTHSGRTDEPSGAVTSAASAVRTVVNSTLIGRKNKTGGALDV
jgi:hypothetical protein